jgi:hypothetical protein
LLHLPNSYKIQKPKYSHNAHPESYDKPEHRVQPLLIELASRNAVVFCSAQTPWVKPMSERMPEWKDARTSEKPRKRHLKLPLSIHNPWRPLAFLWFVLGAEVGWHSMSFIRILPKSRSEVLRVNPKHWIEQRPKVNHK